jgi:hypothetical protein
MKWNMIRSRWILVVAALFCGLSPVSAFGQTFRGNISGTVADKTGAMIPGADVKIEEKETGFKRNMATTGAGVFSFADLLVGFYNITITHSGFQGQRISDLEVQVGRVSSLTVTLEVAQAAETVTVEADAVTIEINQTALNAVVPERAIQEIPLNGRDFSQLLLLTPGFNQGGSMNGNRFDQNNWQIDGVDNNDFWINTLAVNQGSVSGIPGVLLPIDSIEEFNHQSLGGADFGRNPGSMVNVVVKSGTNALHGTAYYFHRNNALAKASPFTPPGSPDKLRNHNFGFSLGGPIIRDKAFFFIAGEGQRFIAGNAILATAPSDAWVARAETVLSAFNVLVNPVMTNLLASLWPNSIRAAPATSPNFFGDANNNYRSDNLVARFDYAFDPKERISLRSFIGSGDATAFAGSVYPDYFASVPSRQENWAAVLNSTFTPRLINQVLFGVNYFLQNFDDASHSANPPAVGFNTGVTSVNFGAPNIEINGFTNGGVGESSAKGRTDTTWHITDDLNYTLGGHALKFGGEFRRAKLWVHYLRSARGLFFFDGTVGPWSGSSQITTEDVALADFLAGFVAIGNAAIRIGDPRRNYYVNSFSGYAHDNWQLTPRLNINFGLRYEYNGPLYDPTHSVSTFLPTAPGGLAFPPQVISTLYPRDLNNFAPRLGFAFSPLRGGHTVIRGAWGVYYDIPNGSLFIDNGGGVASNPGGSKPVFFISNTDPITVVAGQYLFGSVTPTPPFNVFGVDQNFRSPYVQNFSLNVQQQLKSKILLQVAYVGSQSRKLTVSRNINQPAASTTPYADLEAARPLHALFPQFSSITEVSSVGNSQFNSLQISLRAGSWHALTGQIAYTLGHARDDMSSPRFNYPTDNNNLKGDYGNADFDTRHNVNGYLLYDVPHLGHSWARLTKGWELATFLSYNSGFPFTVFSGLGGSDTGSNTGNQSDRADLVGDPFRGISQPSQPQGGLTSGVLWINPTAFSLNAPGTFGNTKRNQFYGPRFKTVDFSVIKNTPVTEKVKAQFRVEMFNVFNILNLAGPSNCICNGGQFGLIGSTLHAGDAPGIGTGEPLNVQLALKLIW